jgi:ATP-dependent Lhr-like helicase
VYERSGILDTVRRFWSVILFVLVLLLFAGSATPWLVVAGTVAAGGVGYLARFLPRWHGIGSGRRGPDTLVEALAQLQGAPLVASTLDRDVLAARVAGYEPSDLDGLCTAGEVVWAGAGAIGSADGRVRLAFRDQAGLLLPEPEGVEAPEPLHEALLAHLEQRGASFWTDLTRAAQQAGQPYDDPTVLQALWDLVWAGLVTNDSLAPLRAYVGGTGRRGVPAAARRAPRTWPRSSLDSCFFSPRMVSMLFSTESFTSSGRTPGSSTVSRTALGSSDTSTGGTQAEVRAPSSPSWNGHPENASSSMRLSRCSP